MSDEKTRPVPAAKPAGKPNPKLDLLGTVKRPDGRGGEVEYLIRGIMLGKRADDSWETRYAIQKAEKPLTFPNAHAVWVSEEELFRED